MNEPDRQQLSEMLSHAASLALNALAETIRDRDRESVGNGILEYEARVAKAAPLIDDALKRFVAFAFGRARHLGGDFGAFELARQQTEQLCTTIQADLPLMLVVLGDSEKAGREFPWGNSARLFGRLRGGLKAAFQIAAQDFRRTPAADPSAVGAEMRHPAGHLTLPHNYVGLADALLELTTALLKLYGRDCDGVYFDNTKQSRQTESDRSTAHHDAQTTAIDLLVRCLTHHIEVPPLEIWTRESPHLAPEQIDHRRLAISHSINWEKTLATGHLAVDEDGLAPLNGWPLFVGIGPWSACLRKLLATVPRQLSQRKPPLPDHDLDQWWQSIEDFRDGKPISKLWEMATAAFPEHHITRERVREKAKGRPVGRRKIIGEKKNA